MHPPYNDKTGTRMGARLYVWDYMVNAVAAVRIAIL